MKKRYIRINVVYTFILIFLILSVPANFSGEVIKQTYTNNKITFSEIIFIPELAFQPKFYDFGYVQEGFVYNTTFEIWNKGTDILEWRLRTRHPWITVYPESGTSTGEHDTINVSINTTGLSLGDYESNVYIHASGDYIFYTYFIVSDAILAYYPESYEFGYVEEGEALQTSFEIWNNGSNSLIWNVESQTSWISVNPSSGSSTGEHDIIDVIINTQGLSSGEQSGNINIITNGGKGNFTILLNINFPPDNPIINGPSTGKRKIEYIYEFHSTDPDSNDIYYTINWGDDTNLINIGPYMSGETASAKHIWNNTGTFNLRVKAEDEYGAESDWTTFELKIPKNKELNSHVFHFILNNLFCSQLFQKILDSLKLKIS